MEVRALPMPLPACFPALRCYCVLPSPPFLVLSLSRVPRPPLYAGARRCSLARRVHPLPPALHVLLTLPSLLLLPASRLHKRGLSHEKRGEGGRRQHERGEKHPFTPPTRALWRTTRVASPSPLFQFLSHRTRGRRGHHAPGASARLVRPLPALAFPPARGGREVVGGPASCRGSPSPSACGTGDPFVRGRR
ncbi:hypothetical protein B0H19DRAFT_1374718 [Mycena capillaripes]|nr:hypothetical protein B0H19DRAFT_1374718 [Mycena capillaripes]